MEVLVRVPDEIVKKLESQWTDLPRHALEALAVEAYRAGILTAAEVQITLGLSTRWETDAVLKRASAFLDYSQDDLQQDLAAFRNLSDA